MPIVQRCGCKINEFDGRIEGDGWALPRTCPFCDEDRLVRHGSYQRWVWSGEGPEHRVWIARMRCKECGRSVAVLPHFIAPFQLVVSAVRERIVRRWSEGPACGAWVRDLT